MTRESASQLLLGCDFSSAPSRQKPIVIALGSQSNGRILLSKLVKLVSLDAFSDWLQQPGPWLGVFDLPFGLPRELVETLGWPTDWQHCIAHYSGYSRDQIRAAFAAFCDARPAGGKFAHRATDRLAGASPSMKWVNPPVAFMLHVGVPLLLKAGVTLPGLHCGAGDAQVGPSQRMALEGYPGLLAREVLGQRSYKSDDKARQTADRLIARKDLITALEQGHTRLGVRLKLTHAQRDSLADDARGDALDAVLCLLQAAWAQREYEAGDGRYGLPNMMDPLEGWIITA
ncbi:DUF429 domain-containing protein [Rhodoferax sp.]|uniref:DUF429 domain-containing protein n=1 Tax=Rhodoferax sp. TaxID=50421 RepID=UPI00284CDDF1|nr:DUF429 domain-containing protein [Rhodoferax sp.]MDR3367744.1 DUF429 domain-containing protein [Rhodoferax sp.]